MRAFASFILASAVSLSSSFVMGQSSKPGYPSNEFICVGEALYVPVNRRIGTFETQAECMTAVAHSRWGLICNGGVLKNNQGRVLDNYFNQDSCNISLWYSSFIPSRICSGQILKNLAGGLITRFESEEECLQAMGKPITSH